MIIGYDTIRTHNLVTVFRNLFTVDETAQIENLATQVIICPQCDVKVNGNVPTHNYTHRRY